MVMMRFVPTGCNAHVGHPRCHPIPHPLRNSIPLENVPDFIAKIKFSPNLIVEVCPVYGGQKQVGAFGCIVLVRIQNMYEMYEMCYINKLALPCLKLRYLDFIRVFNGARPCHTVVRYKPQVFHSLRILSVLFVYALVVFSHLMVIVRPYALLPSFCCHVSGLFVHISVNLLDFFKIWLQPVVFIRDVYVILLTPS